MANKIPKLKSFSPLGHFLEIEKRPLDFFLNLQKEHGDLVRFRVGPYPVYLVSRPEWVRNILRHDVDRYSKGLGNNVLSPLIGESLFFTEGEQWKNRRQMIQPLLHSQSFSKLFPLINSHALEMVKNWEALSKSQTPVDIYEEVKLLTLGIASKGILGTPLFHESRALCQSLEQLWIDTNYRQKPRNQWLPTPSHLRFRKNLKTIRKAIEIIAREHQEDPNERTDLFAKLMKTPDKLTQKPLTPTQLRDEAMTFLIAGQECTAIAITWTLFLVARSPSYYERIETEIREVLGNEELTLERLSQFRFLKMAFNEAMRLYPPAWLLTRQSKHEEQFGDLKLPKGAQIFLSPWVLHRRADIWENPDKFDPDRFSPERYNAKQQQAFMPFSSGPRICAGMSFAYFQATIILSHIFKHFRMQLVSGQVDPEPGITFRPKHGILAKLECIKALGLL